MTLEKFLEIYPNELVPAKDYISQVGRTYSPKFWDDSICSAELQRTLDNVHCVMGIVDEFDEYNDVIKAGCDSNKMVDEMGDILWYVANYCRFNHIPFQKIEAYNVDYDGEFVKLSGIHKKELAYFKMPDIDVCTRLIQTGLTYLIQQLEFELIPLEYVLYINLKKLYIRYPDKFEADLAINKNVDIELTQTFK